MARDKITGEPEVIYCTFCREYIPEGKAADILGRDVCLECKKRFLMALAQFIASKAPMTIYDYQLEIKGPDAKSGPRTNQPQ